MVHPLTSALANLLVGAVPTSVPAVVRQQAEADLVEHPAPTRLEESMRRDAFYRLFRLGFTSPKGQLVSENADEQRAYLAGQAANREADEARFRALLLGFGYTEITTEGTWRRSFEINDFRSVDHPDESWSLTHDRVTLPKNLNNRGPLGSRVRAKGYLSPMGHYGHMGGARRELIATTIMSLAGDE